jgi:hypothetical protein
MAVQAGGNRVSNDPWHSANAQAIADCLRAAGIANNLERAPNDVLPPTIDVPLGHNLLIDFHSSVASAKAEQKSFASGGGKVWRFGTLTMTSSGIPLVDQRARACILKPATRFVPVSPGTETPRHVTYAPARVQRVLTKHGVKLRPRQPWTTSQYGTVPPDHVLALFDGPLGFFSPAKGVLFRVTVFASSTEAAYAAVLEHAHHELSIQTLANVLVESVPGTGGKPPASVRGAEAELRG